MKKSWIKRGSYQLKRTPLRSKSPLISKNIPVGGTTLTGSRLRQTSKSEVAQCKKRIQALLRQLAIKRDQGCVLRHYQEDLPSSYANCNQILQAEHLNTRGSSGSFGDMRNIVCLCQRHHIFFKPQHSQLYWEIIEKHVGEERWAYYKRVRDDHSPHPMRLWDWEKLELELTQQLKNA